MYSPWGCKESDTTEQLALLLSLSAFLEAYTLSEKKPMELKQQIALPPWANKLLFKEKAVGSNEMKEPTFSWKS